MNDLGGGVVMHIRTYLSIFLIGFVFVIAGCSGSSNSGVNKDPIEDIDGDGIADIVDPDIDGDGIPNADDPDDDNDGVEDSVDPTPPVKPGTKTCTAARILPPEGDDHQLGDIGELGWELLPKGCVLPLARSAGQGVPVSATKDDDDEVSNATAKAGNCDGRTPEQVQCGVDIEIPKGCGEEEKADVTFDITEIGLALGDTTLSSGVYKQTNEYRMPKCPNPSFDAVSTRPPKVKTETDANGYTTVFPEGEQVTIFQRGSSDSLCDLKDPRSFFDVTSNSTVYPYGFMNVYVKDCPSDRLTIQPGRSNGTYYFGTEGGGADNFTGWQDVQQSDKYKDCKVNINAVPCPGCVGGYALRLNPENPAIEFTVKKFKVEQGGGGACGAGGEEGAGGSEPTFKVGNGEIETRDSTTCEINSSGAHECIATQTLSPLLEEYFLVSYGVDGLTQLKYFNQPSWSFNPGPGSNPSQKMAVLISEKQGSCPSLGFDAQINQISGWPGRWGIGYNQGNYSWADILQVETANGIARGDMYVCKAIYSTVSGANFFVQHRGKELTMSAYSVSKSSSPVVEINDPDLDNDGTPNDRDADIDGDGLTNDKDPDMDGDGIPNDSDPDVDGDGTPNTSDNDIDGDGIANKNDPDIDGDGIKNGIDKDSDGDGTPDAEDDTPGGPR